MKLNKYKLGKLIEWSDERNDNLEYGLSNVKGISIKKEFIETKADMNGVSLKPYKLVKNDYFAYVPITSRNGNKITLAHNTTNDVYIVSSSYIVFRVIKPEIIDSDYLFMFFNRFEFDRYSRFNSWGSAREAFSWEEMCDIDLELPDIKIQKKYVAIYKSMLENQKCYERGLEDLKIVFQSNIENYKKQYQKVKIGSVLKEVDKRNTNEINSIKGINNSKMFMPTVADISNANLKNYKIVEKNNFAFSGMQTGRDKCIRIALQDKEDEVVITSAYTVLKVTDNNILPEYIMIWFLRSEIDRLGWFLSDSSIRANLDIKDFYSIEIPMPKKEIQQNIIDIYRAYGLRKEINERLKEQIKDICSILIKGSLEEAKSN